LAAAVPRAKLIVLSGVGHMVQFAATERIVAIVGELSAGAARLGVPNAQPEQPVREPGRGVVQTR
jgi:hypothetical protein